MTIFSTLTGEEHQALLGLERAILCSMRRDMDTNNNHEIRFPVSAAVKQLFQVFAPEIAATLYKQFEQVADGPIDRIAGVSPDGSSEDINNRELAFHLLAQSNRALFNSISRDRKPVASDAQCDARDNHDDYFQREDRSEILGDDPDGQDGTSHSGRSEALDRHTGASDAQYDDQVDNDEVFDDGRNDFQNDNQSVVLDNDHDSISSGGRCSPLLAQHNQPHRQAYEYLRIDTDSSEASSPVLADLSHKIESPKLSPQSRPPNHNLAPAT